MESTTRAHNFSAGPSALPDSVLARIQEELPNWQQTGASVVELSHRSEAFTVMAARAESDLRELLRIPENYKVLFLQGGATLQFSQIPMNLLRDGGVCDYVDTGHWSRKAMDAAGRYAQVHIAATANDSGYRSIPKAPAWRISPLARYLHYTANETIDGLEFHWIPHVEHVPLVADFSANTLSRPLDVSRFGLIYAGAQKNIGPSGMTLVIVREDLLGRAHGYCPDVMNYGVQAEHKSLYNTPATFAWYVAGLVFQWLKSLGGLDAMRIRNERKKDILYGQIDGSDFYRNNVAVEDRSHMNVPFSLIDPTLDARFLSAARERGLIGLKGHKVKGGMRASLYNAVPEAAVQALADFMADFEQRHG